MSDNSYKEGATVGGTVAPSDFAAIQEKTLF